MRIAANMIPSACKELALCLDYRHDAGGADGAAQGGYNLLPDPGEDGTKKMQALLLEQCSPRTGDDGLSCEY